MNIKDMKSSKGRKNYFKLDTISRIQKNSFKSFVRKDISKNFGEGKRA